MEPTTRRPPAHTRQALLKRAWQIAQEGDVWFISVAHRLNRIGQWARCEVDAAAGLTASAFSVTLNATKNLTGRATDTQLTRPREAASSHGPARGPARPRSGGR